MRCVVEVSDEHRSVMKRIHARPIAETELHLLDQTCNLVGGAYRAAVTCVGHHRDTTTRQLQRFHRETADAQRSAVGVSDALHPAPSAPEPPPAAQIATSFAARHCVDRAEDGSEG